MNSMNKRAKNLEDADIAQIVEMLDGWSGKLSWNLLIDAIEKRRHMRYTRQALHKHERVAQAYSMRKKVLSARVDRDEITYSSPELQILNQKLARTTAENIRLKSENEHLLEQFVRWAYNAYTRNLDKEFLNRPLPGVNRDVTKPSAVVKAISKKK